MIRLLIPVMAVMLLSACAGTGGMHTSMPCTHCKEHCQCHQNCLCEDCESCPHCAKTESVKEQKPCKICMESERTSTVKVNQ